MACLQCVVGGGALTPSRATRFIYASKSRISAAYRTLSTLSVSGRRVESECVCVYVSSAAAERFVAAVDTDSSAAVTTTTAACC